MATRVELKAVDQDHCWNLDPDLAKILQNKRANFFSRTWHLGCFQR